MSQGVVEPPCLPGATSRSVSAAVSSLPTVKSPDHEATLAPSSYRISTCAWCAPVSGSVFHFTGYPVVASGTMSPRSIFC